MLVKDLILCCKQTAKSHHVYNGHYFGNKVHEAQVTSTIMNVMEGLFSVERQHLVLLQRK